MAGGELTESDVECPFCGESITVFVDCSVERQSYIEDCAVCCRPIQFQVLCEEGELLSIRPARD